MKTTTANQLAVAATAVLVATAFSAHALYEIANKGMWPKTWPEELDPLRKPARTMEHTSVAIYEIPFTNRAEFEAAWPHILKVRSPKSPIILTSAPYRKLGANIPAGVRIHAPLTGKLATPTGSLYPAGAESSVPNGKFLRIGPPWPDQIKTESGALPAYVEQVDGKWKAYPPQPRQDPPRDLRRARTDIELIVDGTIVDLNRIPLPPRATVVDKRFEKKAK